MPAAIAVPLIVAATTAGGAVTQAELARRAQNKSTKGQLTAAQEQMVKAFKEDRIVLSRVGRSAWLGKLVIEKTRGDHWPR